LPVISERKPWRDGNNVEVWQLWTIADRFGVRLWRPKTCECQWGGINPQAVADVVSVERLRKPANGMRQGWNPCLSRRTVTALRGKKPTEGVGIPNQWRFVQNLEVGRNL
jgi:hypothetical protein